MCRAKLYENNKNVKTNLDENNKITCHMQNKLDEQTKQNKSIHNEYFQKTVMRCRSRAN